MASTSIPAHNLETLQLLLQRVPECNTPQSREALLSLVYLEAKPVAQVLLYSILRKKSFYRSDVNTLVHDSATKLVMQYSRPGFEMKNVRSYMYLMVLGTLYPHSDKTFYKHNESLPENDEELTEAFFSRDRLFCDDAHIEQSMYDDLEYFYCKDDFIRIFTHCRNLRQAVRATKSLVPKQFYYKHWGALYSLWFVHNGELP